MSLQLVSVHGGHSGEFCCHARDTLEAVVQAYVDRGFAWVGLTEHMPPVQDCFLYPEERQAGFDTAKMQDRFDRYMSEARRLQGIYRDRIAILVGFETEAYTGSAESIARLILRYRPDYIVGGIHHVADIPFDYGPEAYQQAVDAVGGLEALYCRYFDLQHDIIRGFCPSVVAHFDLIRLFDPHYDVQLQLPRVRERIERNLELIAKLGLILDCNVAALRKGAAEPYPSEWILTRARALDITVVPGDDSHGVETVGARIEDGIAVLKRLGFDTHWPKPGPCRQLVPTP